MFFETLLIRDFMKTELLASILKSEFKNEYLFDCKPVQVAQVFKEPDILIADDDDVSRLRPGTVLEVNIKKGHTAYKATSLPPPP